MASGLPDYKREARLVYGEAQRAAGNVLLTALGTKTLCEKLGKGVIYGGTVYLDHTATQSKAVVELHVDGWQIGDTSFVNLIKYGFVKPRMKSTYLISFDEVNFVYAVGISPGVTFDERVKLRYDERDGGTPTVFYEIFYALI